MQDGCGWTATGIVFGIAGVAEDVVMYAKLGGNWVMVYLPEAHRFVFPVASHKEFKKKLEA